MQRSAIGRFVFIILLIWMTAPAWAQTKARRKREPDLDYPPALPGGKRIVSVTSPKLLQRPATVPTEIAIAKTIPRIDFLYYPEQNYPGKPWSNWGDGSFANGKFYSAIGDHYAIGRGVSEYGTGTAFVYEYDPDKKQLKTLADISKFLQRPEGHYTPAKIHTRVDLGSDGWLYYATHRGSSRVTNDANHYRGDWILRTNPLTRKTEVVVHAPVAKHCIPNGMLDSQRLIYYGGTAPGSDAPQQEIQFFAYDIRKKKLLCVANEGPARSMILAKSSGRVYYVPGNQEGQLLRFDPSRDQKPQALGQEIGIRAATDETDQGKVYTVSSGQRSTDATLWEFDTRTEKVRKIGSAAVGTQAYIASLDVDPTGRYLYYVPGAHGGGFKDGSPLVQFEIKTGKKKVIAFLHPFFQDKFGFTLKGTYCTAVSDGGDKVFVTWNVSRGSRAWDCCGLTTIHIPSSER